MNHYFITGTSRGIGKAIAEQLLSDPENFVTGLSRTSSITHERYTHVEIDLSDLGKVSEFNFPVLEQAKKIALVNNAGAIGKVAVYDYRLSIVSWKHSFGLHRPVPVINIRP